MQPANLTDDRAVTALLIARPLDWKVRVVEEITIDTGTTCLRRRSLQAAPLRELLSGRAPRKAKQAILSLPVAPMPKGQLIDFDVVGPLGPAFLLPRVEIAEREAAYLSDLLGNAGIRFDLRTRRLLAEICGYAGPRLADLPAGSNALQTYLDDGLGESIPRGVLEIWWAMSNECSRTLSDFLSRIGEYRHELPIYPALVIPALWFDGTLLSYSDATSLLASYRELLRLAAARALNDNDALSREFLTALIDYGSNYDLMVATAVPLDSPFLIKIEDRRFISFDRHGNAEQALVAADARTNHITLKVPDTNVVLKNPRALGERPGSVAHGTFNGRSDNQHLSVYAHDPDRDYRIRLSFQLRVLPRLRMVYCVVILLQLLLAGGLIFSPPQPLGTTALVVGPTALVASVLLTREPSTLGNRLRNSSSIILIASLMVLILIATIQQIRWISH